MAYDVFVSHSLADRVLADAIVHELEMEGIDCWIAPRNILPGTNYAEAIVAAIQDVEVMVVVVSDDTNRSGHVPREVERAAAHNVSLVPFRIADIEPSPSLGYFLNCQHWLHALPPPVEAHLTRLVNAVAAVLALRRRPATLEPSRPRGSRHPTATRRPVRVPAPVAVFTGRTAERAEICRQLAEFPVVTLVGPPGAGKTELARVVATDLAASTMAYVDLSALSVRSSLATTVATAVGLDPAATWDETVHALGDTDAVLVLDNAETALAVDADDFRRSLRDLLDRCRSCRILATSRERLGVTGAESIVRVGPLASREAEDLLDKLLSSHAASLSAEDRDAMAQVHAVADGLPLALVFSAAWLSEVSVTTFLQEWQRSRTALLSLPGSDSPDRASSLDVSVALSFDTLKADSRQVLHALSLHPAGATTELLEEILPDDVALVPSIAELVRKSLVEKTGSHLRVLVPIREFVRERAPVESVEPLLLAAIERHRHQLHERLSNAYRIDSGPEWERLAHDLANVGALVNDGLRLPNTVEPAIELVAAACLVFRATGRIDEGLEYLDKALSAVRTGSILDGNLIEERGHLLRAGARLPSALRAYEDALALWSRQSRPDREAVCHLRIGDVLRLMGSYDDAAEHYLIGFRLHEELGENPLARGDAIECLADVARVTGDWHRAITRYTDAQRAFRSVPDGFVGMTNTAHSLGETRLALHDVDGARIDYDQALRISQRIGDLQGQANALLGLAKTDLMREDFSSAQRRAWEAAEIYDQIDDGLGAANALVTVGDLALAQGQFADGDTAYADAEVEFTALSCPLNRVLVSLRRLIARQLGWDSPQVMRAREEFEGLTRRSISLEESRRWPPEKKGSVFHGSLEVTGGGVIISPIVAVVTPFDARGAVDKGALQGYLALLSAAGVKTILVNGTTGEFFNMTLHERGAVLEFCREHWSGQVIAHVGSAAIGDAINLLDHARSHTDYLSAIPPYFFASPPEEGVCAYFRQLLFRSDLPLLLYNFPRHTQTDITPSIVSRLAAEFPLLRGVKDSGKDRSITRQFKAARPDMQVFVGDDRAGAHLAEIGVDGLVTGGGGPVVELPLRIVDAVQSDDLGQAHQLQADFDQWSDARRASPLTEIAFAKAALAARLPGFPPYVRPPLMTATHSQCEEIRSFLRRKMMPLINP